MTDIVDSKTRSRMMSGIRGKNTRPEMILRQAIHARGIRYRLHDARLPGKPDIVFPRYKAVCLVHGCFWHRHSGCPYATTPASRTEFWQRKFADTVKRDKQNKGKLFQEGWRIAIVWECALRNGKEKEIALAIEKWLKSRIKEMNIPAL